MPHRVVTKLFTVLKLPLAGEIIMIFLRRHANKVKYESPLRFSKESSNPGRGQEAPCPLVFPDATS